MLATLADFSPQSRPRVTRCARLCGARHLRRETSPPPQLFPYLYARLDIQVSLMPMIILAVTAAVLPRRVSFAENMDTNKAEGQIAKTP